jgi:hypothetical protein
MATTPLQLATDPSRVNPAGAQQSDLEEYQKSLDAQIKALEQRYANPNWFKVAAGFLKPQLGGFFASVGSASEALGQNIEEQRAAELPIAQMRSQLAQSKILTGQNKTVADMVAEYQASGQPLTPEFVAKVNAIAPDSPSAKALVSQLAAAQKQRELSSSEQANAMQRIQMARQMGTPPNPADLALVASGSPTLPNQATKAPTEAAPTTSLSALEQKRLTEDLARIQRDKESLTREMSRKQSSSTAMPIFEKEMNDLLKKESEINSKLGGAPATTSAPSAKAEGTEYLPMTVAIPKLSDVPDPQRQALITEQTKSRAADLEKGSTERFNNLKNLVAPEYTSAVTAANKTALSLMEDHPELAMKVLNLVRGSGPLAAAMNQGVSAQFNSTAGSFGGAVQFPVEAFVSAKLNPQEQEYADALLNSLSTLKAYSLKMGGVSPTALVNHPAGMTLTQQINFDRNQTPASLYNQLMHFQMTTDFLKDYNNALNQEFNRVDPASLTRMTDAFNSPKLSGIADRYSTVHHEYDRRYMKRRFNKKD